MNSVKVGQVIEESKFNRFHASAAKHASEEKSIMQAQ